MSITVAALGQAICAIPLITPIGQLNRWRGGHFRATPMAMPPMRRGRSQPVGLPRSAPAIQDAAGRASARLPIASALTPAQVLVNAPKTTTPVLIPALTRRLNCCKTHPLIKRLLAVSILQPPITRPWHPVVMLPFWLNNRD